jgi:hypothetical protein
MRFADDKLTVIVLANRGDLNAENLALGIASKVDPTFAKQMSRPIADPDPQMTRRLRRVFLGMISGEMSPEDFSEKLNRELGPLIRRSQAEAKAQATEFAPLESFELLNVQRTEHGTDLQYRATFEYVKWAKVFVSLDESGKIANWGVGPAD